jgi:hypothetical protein
MGDPSLAALRRRLSDRRCASSTACMRVYTDARKKLCRETRATMRTPRKSVCSRKLYKGINFSLPSSYSSGFRARFIMTVPYVAKKVDAMCRRYEGTKSSKRAKQRAYLQCTNLAIEGSTRRLQRIFVNAGLRTMKPYLVFRDENGTLTSHRVFFDAVDNLSKPYNCSSLNIGSLFPICYPPSPPPPSAVEIDRGRRRNRR